MTKSNVFMTKLNFLLALVILVMVAACKDDDDNDTSLKKEDFYGVWEVDGSLANGCTALVKFDATKIFAGTKCGVTQNIPQTGIDYAFDAAQKTITYTVAGNQTKYVVTSKTATKFTADVYSGSQKIGTTSYTKL